MKETNKTVGMSTERLPYEPPRTEVYTVELGSILESSVLQVGGKNAIIYGTINNQGMYNGGFEEDYTDANNNTYIPFGDDQETTSGAKGSKWGVEW